MSLPPSSISRRLPFLLILAVVSAGIGTAIASGLFGRVALEDALQNNLETLAFSQSQQIEQNLKQHISRMLILSEEENIRLELQLSLNQYALLTNKEISDTLQQQDDTWLEALVLENPNDTLIVRNIFLNRISAFTFAFQKESLLTNLGLENNFLLVDKYGGIVAASYLPDYYTHTNELWWGKLQETMDIYLEGPLLPKADTAEKFMVLAIPVLSTKDDGVVGSLYNTFDFSLVTDVIDQVQYSTAGSTILVNSTGHVIYAPETLPIFQDNNLPLEQPINTLQEFDTTTDTFIFTGVPLNSTLPIIDNLGWFVVSVQSRAQALAPVNSAVIPAILIAFVISLFSVSSLYALYIQPLTADISKLQKGAQALSQGFLDTQVGLERKDELGVLAQAFDTMAKRLRNIFATLEDRVRERTNALEIANEQLKREIEERKHAEEKLKKLAITDSLTNLYNRRHFFELAEEEFIRTQRYKHDLVAMMLDLDNFKQINDQYGHIVGDYVLQTIAGGIIESVREVDILGRYGGEEFVVLLPETSLASGLEIAERLCKIISSKQIVTEEYTISITASIGIASLDEDDLSIDMLINRADQALLAAKQAGRDQVSVWQGQSGRDSGV